MTLDPYDRAILEIVTADNRRTHQQIAEAVNLSPSAVRRRLIALNESGVIEANVAITNPARLGLTFIVRVQIADDQTGVARAFEQRMSAEPAVSQCYAVSGDYDYVLVVHAADPAACQSWGERVLVAQPNVRRYDTHLVWERTKFSTRIDPAS